MTTERADNVKVFAFEGGGDDMDAPIKALSTDGSFQQTHALSSVNSINIGRVVSQTVHYVWSYLRAIERKRLPVGTRVQFALPCGALGNATAGSLSFSLSLSLSLSLNKGVQRQGSWPSRWDCPSPCCCVAPTPTTFSTARSHWVTSRGTPRCCGRCQVC